MKEIFNFLQWRYRQLETWQKFWFLGAFFLGAGLGAEGLARTVFISVPFAIFFGYTFKWWIYEPIQNSWKEYKKQRDTLFDTIRGDEK